MDNVIFTVAKNKHEFVRATMMFRSLAEHGGLGSSDVKNRIYASDEVLQDEFVRMPMAEGQARKDFVTVSIETAVSDIPADWPKEVADSAMKIVLLRDLATHKFVTYLDPQTLCVRALVDLFHARDLDLSAPVLLAYEDMLMRPKLLHEAGEHNAFLTEAENADARERGVASLTTRFISIKKCNESIGFVGWWMQLFRSGYMRGRATHTRDSSALNALVFREDVGCWAPIRRGHVRFDHPHPWIRVHPWTALISFMGNGRDMDASRRVQESGNLLW
jgi:hypothetical protein